MSRKTFDVQQLKNKVNRLLATYDSKTVSADYLEGQRNLLEYVLFQTDNYDGFCFLEVSEVPVNEKPGIVWVDKISYTDDRTDGNRVRYL